MEMNEIIAKLRKRNRKQYYILIFSLVLSVVLVASYAVMYYSPTVMTILPEGGDSRKQADMIFAVAIAGCALFTTYASSLFFKYKSNEFGVFMALGENKKALKQVLFREIGLIAVGSCGAGLVLSLPLSWLIWQMFRLFIVDTKEMAYRIGWQGLGLGALFCLFVAICIFWLGRRFIKKSDLIALIRQQKTAETVKSVKPWLGLAGIFLIILGIFLGYCLPILTVRMWGQYMPELWNATYLLTFIGIYFLMLHIVAGKKRGRRPEKYYKNIISVNMMRFTGRQTVRNMCVITLLIVGALFASFYFPTTVTGLLQNIKTNPVDNTFFYRETEDQVQRDEIYALADKYGTEITSYQELTALSLYKDGIISDFDEEKNKLTEEYAEITGYGKFFSVSDYNAVAGEDIQVDNGTYKIICYPEQEESVWDHFQDLTKITDPVSGEVQEVQYDGRVDFTPLCEEYDVNYILSDDDYAKYSAGLTDERRFCYVLFNVKNPDDQYAFASALKDEIILRSSPEAAVGYGYNEYNIEQAEAAGEEIDTEQYTVDLSLDNNQLYLEWDYYPAF
ncbi:MAG: ABC transporter permease, partial [Bacillota bacterium]|nr:ABC transporter permease [Bacillota bacterium]